MPVVKIFCPSAPEPAALERLGASIEHLCVEGLRAQVNAVQIAVVPQVRMARGAALLVEVHYRARADRDGPMLDRFMQGLEEACLRELNLLPRIRCFAVDQALLFARN